MLLCSIWERCEKSDLLLKGYALLGSKHLRDNPLHSHSVLQKGKDRDALAQHITQAFKNACKMRAICSLRHGHPRLPTLITMHPEVVRLACGRAGLAASPVRAVDCISTKLSSSEFMTEEQKLWSESRKRRTPCAIFSVASDASRTAMSIKNYFMFFHFFFLCGFYCKE